MKREAYLEHIDFAATTKFDFTPLFNNPQIFRSLILDLVRQFRHVLFDKIGCPESLGFLLGSAAACELKKGPVPIRKGSKLPNIRHNIVSQRFTD